MIRSDTDTQVAAASRTYAYWRRACPIGVIFVASAVAYWISLQYFPSQSANRGLVIEQQYLDFGQVWETDAFSWKLPITNKGESEVDVLELGVSCEAASIKPSSFRLPPGGVVDLALTLDLSRQPCGTSGSDIGKPTEFNVMIAPQFVGSVSFPHGWRLTGKVQRILALDTRSINFGQVKEHQSRTKSIKIRSNKALAELKAVCDSQAWSCAISKQDSPNEYTLTVFSHEYLLPGPFEFSTMIRPSPQDRSRCPEYQLTVRGTVISEFSASPPALLLGPKYVGANFKETITLLPPHDAAVEVVRAQSDSKDTRVSPTDPLSSQCTSFYIEQLVSLEGKQRRDITFLITTKAQQRHTLVFPIEYHGLTDRPERK